MIPESSPLQLGVLQRLHLLQHGPQHLRQRLRAQLQELGSWQQSLDLIDYRLVCSSAYICSSLAGSTSDSACAHSCRKSAAGISPISLRNLHLTNYSLVRSSASTCSSVARAPPKAPARAAAGPQQLIALPSPTQCSALQRLLQLRLRHL